MAPSSLGKQTADCESPHNWLISLALIYLLCVTCGGENGTNGSNLGVFSKDVAFAHHFVAPHPLCSQDILLCKVNNKLSAYVIL